MITEHRSWLRRFIVVAAGTSMILAGCSSDTGSRDAGARSKPTPSGATGSSIGTGSTQFHAAVAATCADIAVRLGSAGPDFQRQADLYADAQARLQSVKDRTAADDQILRYVDAQLIWLRTVRDAGMGRAGPPPMAPPAAAMCRVAGTSPTSSP